MIKQKLHRPDLFLMGIVIALVVIGIIMIFSASGIMVSNFVLKQSVWAFLGMLALFCMAGIDYHKLQRLSRILLTVSGILLVLVLLGVLSDNPKGIHRWMRLGPIGFQPSEIAKICLIVYLADLIDRKQSRLKEFKKGIMPALIMLGIFSLLIYKGPDLGTVILLVMVAFIMLLIGGARIRHLVSLSLLSLPILIFTIVRTPYRLKRLWAFLDPSSDSKGAGWQVYQSLVALGSGGINGVGLGKSIQKFFYLPEPHTDFIFSIIGEELGFIGSLVIVVLFILFIWRGAKIAVHAPDLFGSLLAAGLTFTIGLQALVNIGVVTGSLPTKGVPLPFLSFGGSSLLCTMVGVGILLNISKHTN